MGEPGLGEEIPARQGGALHRLASLLALVGVCAAEACLGSPALAAVPSVCPAGPLTGYAPDDKEVAAHRRFKLPTLRYPFDTHLPGRWGVSLAVLVNAAGQVTCYRMKDELGKDQPLTDPRRTLLQQLKDWRYAPFTQGKLPVQAVFSEHIGEEEEPKEHVPLPAAPIETLRVRLEHGPCYGGCPSYSVEVSGDGHVTYTGVDYVDVLGEHPYQVPREDVAGLLPKLRAGDLWSMRPRYRAMATDIPAYTLVIRLGHDEHRIVDYGGSMVGMPAAVSDFEQAVDQAAHADKWVVFSGEALEHLKAEHFDFHSREAAELLTRAVADSRDEKALVELVSLGAPTDGRLGEDDRLQTVENVTLIEEALLNGFPALTDALIAKGALQSHGKLSQRKLDTAFQAAIVGGRLALVQKIWGLDPARHPALTYIDPQERFPGKPLPVTLLLSPARNEDHPWEGLQLVKWLEAQGCDLKAASPEGITLLHVAATARDVQLVRYLITRGVKDPSSGQQQATALQSAQDEDIALLLLQSGASAPKSPQARAQYRSYAQSRHWSRVVSWLQAHTIH